MAELTRAERFERDGVVVVEGLLARDELDWYREVYERFLAGAIDVGRRRSDLGSGTDTRRPGVPGSHRRPMRPHRPAGRGGGALECDASETEGTPVPLAAGSCTFHHGGTLHYSRGNRTGERRRALIVNFRPRAMIERERSRGFDHGKDAPGRENRNPLTR